MARKNRLKELESELGNLEEVIPPKVNRQGQRRTAQELGVSESTINDYLKKNGWKLHMVYVKQQKEGAGGG